MTQVVLKVVGVLYRHYNLLLTILQAHVKIVSMSRMRYLQVDLDEICFSASKMAFISGPRQVGKTTFAKSLLTQRETGQYYTWDEITFRRLWVKDPSQILTKHKQG